MLSNTTLSLLSVSMRSRRFLFRAKDSLNFTSACRRVTTVFRCRSKHTFKNETTSQPILCTITQGCAQAGSISRYYTGTDSNQVYWIVSVYWSSRRCIEHHLEVSCCPAAPSLRAQGVLIVGSRQQTNHKKAQGSPPLSLSLLPKRMLMGFRITIWHVSSTYILSNLLVASTSVSR